MHDEALTRGPSAIHAADPRLRVLAALVLSIVLALADRWPVATGGLGLAILTAGLARLPLRPILTRLTAVNVFALMIAITLPISVAGTPVVRLGPLAWSAEGLVRAGLLAVKANAIVLLYTALISTATAGQLGHALRHLRVPDKLVLIYFFAVRYAQTLHEEYLRLRRSMRARGFRLRTNLHSLRTIGQLLGMLAVRSVERAERVHDAMVCRAWDGRVWVWDHFHFHRRDIGFAVAAVVAVIGLAWGQWA